MANPPTSAETVIPHAINLTDITDIGQLPVLIEAYVH